MTISVWMMTKCERDSLTKALQSIKSFCESFGGLLTEKIELVFVVPEEKAEILVGHLKTLDIEANIVILLDDNGVESAMRKAIRSTHGSYVVSCQDDEELLPEMKNLILNSFWSLKDVGASIGSCCLRNTDGSESILTLEKFDLLKTFDLSSSPPWSSTAFNGLLLREAEKMCPSHSSIETFVWLYLAAKSKILASDIVSSVYQVHTNQDSVVHDKELTNRRLATIHLCKLNLPPYCNL